MAGLFNKKMGDIGNKIHVMTKQQGPRMAGGKSPSAMMQGKMMNMMPMKKLKKKK